MRYQCTRYQDFTVFKRVPWDISFQDIKTLLCLRGFHEISVFKISRLHCV